MPHYLVKVTDIAGLVRPPIVAHSVNEEEAERDVRAVFGDAVAVKVRGIRPDVMIASFGELPLGVVESRGDWIWLGQGQDEPAPST